MSVVTKTFAFTGSAEGLADDGNSSNIGFAFSTNHVEFSIATGKGLVDEFETASIASPTDTWEDWGVWAGGTVTDIQVTDYDREIENSNAQVEACQFIFDIYDGGSNNVSTIGVIIDTAFADETGWQAQGAQTSRSVSASYQESTQVVEPRLSITLDTDSTGPNPNFFWNLRNVDLEITFTGGTAPDSRRVFIISALAGMGLVGQTASQIFSYASEKTLTLFNKFFPRKRTVKVRLVPQMVPQN